MIVALLLAAAPPAPTAGWLAGRWVPSSEASRQDAEACIGEDTRTWRPDGSFADAASEGDWSLERGRLIEADVGGTRVSRVVRLAPDRMRLIDADGEQVDWWRCRRR